MDCDCPPNVFYWSWFNKRTRKGPLAQVNTTHLSKEQFTHICSFCFTWKLRMRLSTGTLWYWYLRWRDQAVKLSSGSCSNKHMEGWKRKSVLNPWEMHYTMNEVLHLYVCVCVCLCVWWDCHSLDVAEGVTFLGVATPKLLNVSYSNVNAAEEKG